MPILRFTLAAGLLGGVLFAQQPSNLGKPRCATPTLPPTGIGVDHPDCDYNNTNPSAAYAPTTLLRIPVVVHVIRTSSGATGDLSNALVQSQITVLNEDFKALTGTAGANGVDTKIEFFLATTDPNNQPTTGIVRYNNSTWFNDAGAYYNSIAWNPTRYLNIYTNNTSALGYVPDLPQGGSVLNTNADRVVIYYGAFGRPALGGAPYNLGRTATHEVGHYLGLFHTFEFGCGTASCYTSGDRICDTNAEANPRFGCPVNAVSCGSLDPIRNYMDYTDDSCMQGFTAEQARRMRCTLQHYRPQLAQPAGPLASAVTRPGAGNLNTNLTATAPRLGQSAQVQAITFGTGFTSALAYGFLAPANSPFQNYTVLVDITSPQIFILPLQNNPIVCQWNYNVPPSPTFGGVPISVQGVMLGTTFGLTNAMDLVLGN